MCWMCVALMEHEQEQRMLAVAGEVIDSMKQEAAKAMPPDVNASTGPFILLCNVHCGQAVTKCPVCGCRTRQAGPRERGYRSVCTVCGEWIK